MLNKAQSMVFAEDVMLNIAQNPVRSTKPLNSLSALAEAKSDV